MDADLLLTGSVKQHWAYVNHLRLHSVPAQSQKVNDIPMAQLVLAGGAADQLTKLLNMLCSRLLTSLPSVCSRGSSIMGSAQCELQLSGYCAPIGQTYLIALESAVTGNV